MQLNIADENAPRETGGRFLYPINPLHQGLLQVNVPDRSFEYR
ncbi:MAG: hypothetical protein M0T70_04175 [Geobacteraceae bacterium]|nr:hypothetical protein [Geobacteraceae bacterium]